MAETKWKDVKTILVVGGVGLGTGALAAVPQETWSASWGNFLGAALVAVGGILGCLHHAKATSDLVATVSWACIVVGGCVIAGASLQAALMPAS